MKTIKIPYYTSSLDLHIGEENLEAVITAKTDEYDAGKTEAQLVEEALANPIGTPRLCELAKGKNRIVLVTSDHTRAVPSKLTLPILLREIRSGNPDADITILIATGLHRPTTEAEQRRMFGDSIVDNEKIAINDAFKDDDFGFVRTLPSGAELWVNKLALDCDLLITEGFIEPHFFAGFSGGRKSILPGIASATTVMANHCSEFIASPYARTGILKNNPIHRDMLYAAQQAKLAFILNVVIDAEKKVIGAFAGDSEQAHVTGCEFVLKMAEVKANPSDIVVTTNGGYPLDQNIYQSVKGMTAAEANCKEGGVIIMVSACNDGHGGQSFYENLRDAASPRALLERIAKVPRNETIPDQWEMQILARILDKFTVIMVTDMCSPEMIKEMHMEHAATFQEALQRAFEIKGNNASVTVIPDGVSVIVRTA